MNHHQERGWVLTFLFLTMSLSSIVLIEPSPYDLFLCLFILFGCIYSLYGFHSTLILPSFFLLFFLLANLLSAFFAKNDGGAFFYFIITVYLVVSWIAIVGASFRYKNKIINTIFKGYVVAALISVTIGAIAFFFHSPVTETFLQFGRIRSLFKDPNVFGPFLVPAALFALYKTESSSFWKRWSYFGIFLFFLMGILLSFSRAAWGNCLLALGCYFLLLGNVSVKRRISTLVIFSLAGTFLLIYLANTPLIENLLTQRLTLQHYDSDRFATQRAAFESGFANLFGLGPGQSEENFEISTHSLYARIFTENGIIGFISFCSFLVLSMTQALKRTFRSSCQTRGLYAIIFSSLAGAAFNSIFIDTLHWRHFWLVLALAWCMDEDNMKRVHKEKGGNILENRSAHYQDG
jgi:O-antigen ligase